MHQIESKVIDNVIMVICEPTLTMKEDLLQSLSSAFAKPTTTPSGFFKAKDVKISTCDIISNLSTKEGKITNIDTETVTVEGVRGWNTSFSMFSGENQNSMKWNKGIKCEFNAATMSLWCNRPENISPSVRTW